MKPWQRIVLAIAIVAVDTAAFYIPLTGLLAAYVILAQPPWFARLVARIYRN